MPTDISPERTQSDARGAILVAARELFLRDGYEAVSVDQVLRAAEVSRGGMYHHFDGKKALLLAVYEEVERETVTAIATDAAARAGDGGPFAMIEAAAEAYLDAATRSPALRFALFDVRSYLTWTEWHDVAMGLGLGLTVELVKAAAEAGEIRTSDPTALAYILLGAMIEATTWVASSADPATDRKRASQAIQQVLGGVRVG